MSIEKILKMLLVQEEYAPIRNVVKVENDDDDDAEDGVYSVDSYKNKLVFSKDSF